MLWTLYVYKPKPKLRIRIRTHIFDKKCLWCKWLAYPMVGGTVRVRGLLLKTIVLWIVQWQLAKQLRTLRKSLLRDGDRRGMGSIPTDSTKVSSICISNWFSWWHTNIPLYLFLQLFSLCKIIFFVIIYLIKVGSATT